MKRIFFISIAVFFSLFLFLGSSSSFLRASTVFAQTATPTLTPTVIPTGTPVSASTPPNAASGEWIQDPTVTFLGKTASRSANFMDWTLSNYKWDYLDDSLVSVWVVVRNIMYAMLVLLIMIAAFFIIISGGSNVGVLIFARKFIIVLLLVTFSFAIVRFLYQITDILQVFFFNISGNGIIQGKDVVNISFSYQDFFGYRRLGPEFDESAFISLLLVKISAVTFYVIGFILTVRKIILWFFLAASPLYPFIILYFPLKNTAKILRSEFLRWLFYAPLFSLFLSAVVIIWKSNILVLPFKFQSAIGLVYPTAISILLGGPGQTLSLTNSLNYNDTFIQYVIALLMLWVAILMPFILLQIFLDFLSKYEFGKSPLPEYINTIQNNVLNNRFSFLKKPIPPSPLPVGEYPAGQAREIPKHTAVVQKETSLKQTVATISEQQKARQQAGQTSFTQLRNIFRQQQATSQTQQNMQTTNQNQRTNITNVTENKQQTTQVNQRPVVTAQFKPEILARATTGLINFPIPTMRDIVKFETARLSRVQVSTHQLQQTQKTLEKIANPKVNTTPAEEQHFTVLREQLNEETTKGDILAKSILSAVTTLQVPQEQKLGETSAPSIQQTLPDVTFPAVNQIQTVSFDDYEAVKALWLENYQQIDVPEKYSNRRAWIEDDGEAVSEAITLLSSPDPMKVREGLSSVSNILPFLLIGGFSQTEVIAYLRAKHAAAKSALEELAKQEENQETLLEKGARKEIPKQLSEEAEMNEKDKNN